MKNNLTPHQVEALDFQRHVSLTANAGSGKTFVFAKRFVEIALSANISLRNIVAITFTDKAAGELNARIANEVEERIESESDSEKLRKLRNIRRGLVSANISTIHSFCIDLLKEYSPEAGIDANFVPIDPKLAVEMLELCVDESVNYFLTDEDFVNDYKQLVRLFGSKKLFRKQLISLMDRRKTLHKIKESIYCKTDTQIIDSWNNLFAEEFRHIFFSRMEILSNSLQLINSEVMLLKPSAITSQVESILQNLNIENDVYDTYKTLCELGELILTKSSGEVKKRDYLSNKELIPLLVNDISTVENFFLDFEKIKFTQDNNFSNQELVSVGRSFIKLFDYVEMKYNEKKFARGFLDFEDILLHTLNLTSQEEVVKQLGEKFHYVMIDEYQDTNDVQYNIFMPVLNNLKQGNLFVVGDEKQSIYMFRDADIEIYQQTKNDLEVLEEKAKLISLPHSFRMFPEIAAFTNLVFANLFQNPDPLFGEVEYSNLICAKETDDKGHVEILTALDEEGSQTETDLIAARILQIIENDDSTCFDDIAILCRKRSHFKALEDKFSQYNIPYSVVGGKGFYQQQIVHDVCNYLSFLIDQNNNTALVGLMRSPFMGLSDANIFEISLEKGSNYFNKFSSFVLKNKYFEKNLEVLKKHIDVSATLTFSQLIRMILVDTGYWAMISILPDAIQLKKNLEKLITIASNYATQSFVTLYDFVKYLNLAIESNEDEGHAVVDEKSNSIKLMTIHQSKGLEFNAVFLFRTHEYGKDSSIRSKQIEIDKKYGILAKVNPQNNIFEEAVSPPILGLYNYVNNKKQLAELKRLLYVAITRSVKYLFITVTKPSKPRSDSFWGLLSQALPEIGEGEQSAYSSKLEYMYKKGDEFEFEEKTIDIELPVTYNLPLTAPTLSEESDTNYKESVLLVDSIEDQPSGEIISATKIAVYTQCPLKYQLTYELGFSYLAELVKTNTVTFDFNYREDDETIGLGDIKGSVVHRILDKGLEPHNYSVLLDLILEKEITRAVSLKEIGLLKSEITDLLDKYYLSDIYKKLLKYDNYKNEHEIYVAEEDYYFFGIIDKLIFEDGKITIVDYKTDNVKKEEIETKGNDYLIQLMFYANLVARKYSDYDTIELRLVFIQQPEEEFVRIINKADLDKFTRELKDKVKSIREKKFDKNESHCIKCHYTIGRNKCIKK
ncbi:MAG: UvrD-helicase domain-containing protein [Bacteroidetes bacterium]|nr:UvrD-helicase domain-containing protein [Bacteroidota bacterium]